MRVGGIAAPRRVPLEAPTARAARWRGAAARVCTGRAARRPECRAEGLTAQLALLHERTIVLHDEGMAQARQDVDLALGYLLVGGGHVRHRDPLVHHELPVAALHEEAPPVTATAELPDGDGAVQDVGKVLLDRHLRARAAAGRRRASGSKKSARCGRVGRADRRRP